MLVAMVFLECPEEKEKKETLVNEVIKVCFARSTSKLKEAIKVSAKLISNEIVFMKSLTLFTHLKGFPGPSGLNGIPGMKGDKVINLVL